jgi:hypothetical protein
MVEVIFHDPIQLDTRLNKKALREDLRVRVREAIAAPLEEASEPHVTASAPIHVHSAVSDLSERSSHE